MCEFYTHRMLVSRLVSYMCDDHLMLIIFISMTHVWYVEIRLGVWYNGILSHVAHLREICCQLIEIFGNNLAVIRHSIQPGLQSYTRHRPV